MKVMMENLLKVKNLPIIPGSNLKKLKNFPLT